MEAFDDLAARALYGITGSGSQPLLAARVQMLGVAALTHLCLDILLTLPFCGIRSRFTIAWAAGTIARSHDALRIPAYVYMLDKMSPWH
jgi:hypothetical protein